MDAISTTNAYLDSTAISVGIAIQSGVTLQKCGNYWCRIGTSQVVNSSLANSTTSTVVAINETYKYNTCNSWITQSYGVNKIANSCPVSGNGLIYSNCDGNVRTRIESNTYCTSIGMRMPIISETTATVSNGVPSCTYNTWTNSYSSYGGAYTTWSNLSVAYEPDSYAEATRCVK